MRTTIFASMMVLVLGACSRESPAPASASATTTANAAATANASATANATAAGGESASASMDAISTSGGSLGITPLKHASLLFSFGGKTIAIDPTGDALRPDLPKADYVFVTDIHPDHLDSKAIDAIAKPGAVLVGPPAVDAQRKMGVVLKNGESHDFGAFKVEAIPMYNVKRGPEAGKLFHDKGRGDGYVFTFGDKRVYVSGDTECTPEMRALKDIDVAFVCMNLPYTMTPEEAGECVAAFKPKIVYPYHYRGQDPSSSFATIARRAGVDVRLRDWYPGGNGANNANSK